MTGNNTAGETNITGVPPRASEWKRFRRVFFQRKIVIFGLIVLFLLIFTASFADWLVPYDPYKQDLNNVLLQPNKAHLLGTDPIGRDTLSRLIYGSRTVLIVGFSSVVIAASAGIFLGMLAGYSGGVVNMIIMRLADILMPFPMIVLALLIAALLGSGVLNVIIALSIATLPGYIRMTHGIVLSIKENDYILAMRAFGSSNTRIMFRHILPNAFPPTIVLVTLQLGFIILSEAALSYLGIGITPPGADWGAMVNEGYSHLMMNPVLSFAPGLAIMLVVFAFNLIGDGLRDALDPRLRGLL